MASENENNVSSGEKTDEINFERQTTKPEDAGSQKIWASRKNIDLSKSDLLTTRTEATLK